MSEKYQTVKEHYDNGRWTIQQVKNVVTAPIPWITQEEYLAITGFVYPDMK